MGFGYGIVCASEVKNGGPEIVKNGPRVWAFCKIEFPGIQKPVQILTQKSGFFGNPGNRGVGVIWSFCGVFLFLFILVGGFVLLWGLVLFGVGGFVLWLMCLDLMLLLWIGG